MVCVVKAINRKNDNYIVITAYWEGENGNKN